MLARADGFLGAKARGLDELVLRFKLGCDGPPKGDGAIEGPPKLKLWDDGAMARRLHPGCYLFTLQPDELPSSSRSSKSSPCLRNYTFLPPGPSGRRRESLGLSATSLRSFSSLLFTVILPPSLPCSSDIRPYQQYSDHHGRQASYK